MQTHIGSFDRNYTNKKKFAYVAPDTLANEYEAGIGYYSFTNEQQEIAYVLSNGLCFFSSGFEAYYSLDETQRALTTPQPDEMQNTLIHQLQRLLLKLSFADGVGFGDMWEESHGEPFDSETYKERYDRLMKSLNDRMGDEEIKSNAAVFDLTANRFKPVHIGYPSSSHVVIDPAYQPKQTGAFPLIGHSTLMERTNFYRAGYYSKDFRYNPTHQSLSLGTYLTPYLDRPFGNSGFAIVGRSALPLPLPARFLFQYSLPKGTQIRVGTVKPDFGQAGGGVEIQIVGYPQKYNLVYQRGPFLLPSF